MSYSFSWDCTLPINNIQDIISINIVPETKTYHEEEYLTLRGSVCIQGEYLSQTGKQHIFDEKIPLDITLPNNRSVNQIETELTNFDYDIREGEDLFLKVDLILVGYELETEESLETEASSIFDRDELDYGDLEELVLDAPIETVDLTISQEDTEPQVELVETTDEEIDRKELHLKKMAEKLKPAQVVETVTEATSEVIENLKPSNVAKTVTEAATEVGEKLKPSHMAEVLTEVVTEVGEKLKPSHMAEVLTETVTEVGEKLKPSHVAEVLTETVTEVGEKLKPSHVAEVLTETVTEVGEKLKPSHVAEVVTETVMEVGEKLKPSHMAEVLMDTVTEVGGKLKPSHVEVATETMTEKVEKLKPTQVEEILPFPIKSDKTTIKEQTQTMEESNLFDMLYGLETNTSNTESTKGEIVVEKEESKQVCNEKTKELEAEELENECNQEIRPFFNDSVASQFDDGASIVKIIFIQEEATIGSICEQYDVTEQAIINLKALGSPLKHGDCVMINYGRVQ